MLLILSVIISGVLLLMIVVVSLIWINKYYALASQCRTDYQTVKQEMLTLLETIAFEKPEADQNLILHQIDHLKIDNIKKFSLQEFYPLICSSGTLREMKEDNRNSKIENELYQDFRFYQEVLNNLFSSMISNISETSEPISDELFRIGNNISGFFKSAKLFESEWKNQQSLKEISLKEKELSENKNICSEHINAMTLFITNNMSKFSDIITRIEKQAGNIREISENIRILAVNASIEAARAGAQGRAFNIIATEIRELSDKTNEFVRNISSTILLSKESVHGISRDFRENQKILIGEVGKMDLSNIEFEEILSGFLKKQEDLSFIINAFIDSIRANIIHINPVVQLHAITVQEMENLRQVMQDFFLKNMNLLKNKGGNVSGEFNRDTGILLTEVIRKRLTSSRELDSLLETLKTFGLDEAVDLKRTDREIEFF
jgi:nucleoside-triphosphatase THEP1